MKIDLSCKYFLVREALETRFTVGINSMLESFVYIDKMIKKNKYQNMDRTSTSK